MPVTERRTKHDLRSAATRDKLLTAARTLFGQRGYAGVGTEEIVRAAGVTRGALYHQYRDKAALFTAVVEAIEKETSTRIAQGMADAEDPVQAMHAGMRAFLLACAHPEVERIVLLDGPVVLGPQAWQELRTRHGVGLVEAALLAGIAAGALRPQPVTALAHLLVGALDEAARYSARASDPTTARKECLTALERMIAGLLA